jgi:hypothetical protein
MSQLSELLLVFMRVLVQILALKPLFLDGFRSLSSLHADRSGRAV